MIGTRHKYRKPRFKPFKASLVATAPALMLLIGMAVSVTTHVALSFALAELPIAHFNPADFEREHEPVRIKRARFDQVITPDRGGAGGDGVVATPQPTAEELAETLMDEVETVTSDPFEPELELRSVPEPLPRPTVAAVPPATVGFDLNELLDGSMAPPEPPTFTGAEDLPFGAAENQAPGSAELSGDLLATLTAPDGGLPAGGSGDDAASAGGGMGVAEEARRFGPGSGGGGTGGKGRGGAPAPGSAAGDALGMDFLDFGGMEGPDFEPPQVLDEDFDYAVAKYDAPGNDGWFRIRITGKRSLRKLATMPKDVVFMVDTSRSIPQNVIDAIGAGIEQSIAALNDGDRFNLVFFSDDVKLYATEPVAPTPRNVDIAKRWLRSAKARGSTDVNAAIRQLLKRDIEPGRVYELILISDGNPTIGVLDTRELINLITRENDLAASIYCVGIGREQDTRLLEFLAYRNKGFAVSVPDSRDVEREIIALMSRLRYPIITDVQVRFAGSDMGEVYPLTLPNIHQGESFEVFGRFKEPGPFTIQVTGRSLGEPVDLTHRADLAQAPRGSDNIAKGWAFWKLHHLYSEIIRVGEREELLKEINELHQRYQLETLY